MIQLLILIAMIGIGITIVRRLPNGCQCDCNQGRNCTCKESTK